ncbi:MAG TPA: FAD-dependent oxidoreductase [Verrucomicrobiales bacterium]|nr:FAD-dependent oxidoreductase [Verrucomicrobiales bacterium]
MARGGDEMRREYDIAILGSGFAGSLLAMALRRMGRRVILLERGHHPRFAIGESSTPLTNLWLEEYAARYDLPGIASFAKWGTWQRDHPRVGCGLKRGFTFYGHRLGSPFTDDAEHRHQLLVAASPHDAIADTHWYRPEFDHHLVQEAVALGVDHIEGARVERADLGSGGGRLSVVVTGGEPLEVVARFVVDATGPRGCLHRLLGLGEASLPGVGGNCALFTHFRDVAPVGSLVEFNPGGRPPYPPDDAALHHVFPGGWIWVLRFNNGITSAGAALSPGLAGGLGIGEGAPAWGRLLARLPSVERQFREARPVAPFVHQSPMPFLSARGSGPGWAMLPSAQGFADPLLSTGFALNLLGLHRLTRAIREHWDDPSRLDQECAMASQASRGELLRVAGLVAALYRGMDDFGRFAALTKLYFAAVSYTETVLRLGRGDAGSTTFLMSSDPVFGPGIPECAARVLSRPSAEAEEIVARCIERIDIAGLSGRERRNWHPADAEDLRRGRSKLGATAGEIEALLARCGFQEGARPGGG